MKGKKQTCYFESGTDFSPFDFSRKLEKFIQHDYKINGPRPILFFCIGSDRITGDSLGPLIGYKLEQHLRYQTYASSACKVLGTLSQPIHALNLENAWDTVAQQETPFLTIAIDAAIGTTDSCGYITLTNRPLAPGEGVRRSLPRVGQISITGIVSAESCDMMSQLQNVRLSSVMLLADCICEGILTFLSSCSTQLPVPATIPDLSDKIRQNLPASACSSDPSRYASHTYL